MADSQRCSIKIYLHQLWRIFLFILAWKVINSDNFLHCFLQRKCASYFCTEITIEKKKNFLIKKKTSFILFGILLWFAHTFYEWRVIRNFLVSFFQRKWGLLRRSHHKELIYHNMKGKTIFFRLSLNIFFIMLWINFYNLENKFVWKV